jgi:hypothetical protein
MLPFYNDTFNDKVTTGLINAVTYLGLLAIVEPFGRKYELLK